MEPKITDLCIKKPLNNCNSHHIVFIVNGNDTEGSVNDEWLNQLFVGRFAHQVCNKSLVYNLKLSEENNGAVLLHL